MEVNPGHPIMAGSPSGSNIHLAAGIAYVSSECFQQREPCFAKAWQHVGQLCGVRTTRGPRSHPADGGPSRMGLLMQSSARAAQLNDRLRHGETASWK